MRIAQIMAGARDGGAELFFERLCLALHRAGETVLPVIRTHEGRGSLLRDAGMSPVQLAFGTALDLLTRPRLRRALQAFGPDIAIYWMNRANQHRVRGPWVTAGRLGGYYSLRHYRGCDHLIGNTEGIVAWLRSQGWPAERTHYVPNFATDYGPTPPADRAELCPPGHRLLLGLGRLHTDKGFDLAIEALSAVPRAILAIAGSGPEGDSLARRAARLGVADRVRFLGWRRDPGALLRAADVFVCSSRVEPLGNMVLEAWSARTPIVAAAAAGPRELLRPERDGLLVPMERPDALAAAINALLGDEVRAAALAAAGRARFEESFAEAPVLASWRAFLDRVSRTRRASPTAPTG